MLAPTPGCAGTPFWAFLGGGEGRSQGFPHQSGSSGGLSCPRCNLVNRALGPRAMWLLVKCGLKDRG